MLSRRSCCVWAWAAAAAPAARGQRPWRLATGYRAESFHGRNLAALLDELAAGGLAVQMHANNSLYKLPEIFGAVRAGHAEMGEVILTGLSDELPLAGADAVPFIVRGYEDAERLWRCQRPWMERDLQARGLVGLLAVPWPPQGLYSSRPVTRVADLKGRRMRTYNRTTERIAALVGATAVDVPMVQVGQALAEGRIDCMITSAVTGVEGEVWRHLRHYYEINAWIPKNLTFVNAAAWQALPAGLRDHALRAARSAEARGWRASADAAATSMEQLRAGGMKVERPAHELMADLRRLGERFSLEWLRATGPAANRVFVPYYTQP